MSFWGRYVSVGERRAKAERAMEKLRKKGQIIQPVEIEGRTITRSFWGKGWCDHLESFSDFANRLPRGRTYVRNGSVCHLEIKPGCIEAIVSGSSLYKVKVKIKPLKPAVWKSIKKKCSGQIGSMLELLQGKLSKGVMEIVSDRKNGLFPQPSEIELKCNCPDWAVMCKHVAAALYGIGNRLDSQPELLFVLRNVDAQELIATGISLPLADTGVSADALADDQLGGIFDVDMDTDVVAEVEVAKPKKSRSRKKVAAPIKKQKKMPSSKVKTSRASVGQTETITPPIRKAKSPRKLIVPKSFLSKKVPLRKSPGNKPTAVVPRIRPTGASVLRLRKKLGLSVAEFSKQVGVSPASVYNWEATGGRLKIRATSLHALAVLHEKAK